jgi:phage terminase large subunit-like protein
MSNAPAWKTDRLAVLERQLQARRQNRINLFRPYPKQFAFFEMGATKRERLFMAGNKVGKTISGAFEAACHATGLYPEWWPGKRFNEPTTGWIGGETGELVRDVQQAMLFGTPGIEADWGTGMIPKSHLIGRSLGHGVSNFYDTVMVKHVSGGTSIIGSKTYVQGRERWQASYLHWLWPDEEPPPELYSEGLARLRGDGIVFTTFTPFKGYTDVIRRFLHDYSLEARRDRGVVRMGLRDAEHFTEEQKQIRLSSYPAHERAARENGDPLLGSGAVFEEVIESDISTRMILSDVPRHWPKLWGLDFGIAHPFAAVLIAWDRDTDTIYVVEAFKMSGGTPINHAHRMKAIAPDVPVSWPHDGAAREAGSGEALIANYKREGLKTLPSHATFASGGYSTEAGILEMLTRMRDGRFKVAAHLADWWDEFRGYHRKDGQIVKINDDLMSASRIAVMAHRNARVAELPSAFYGHAAYRNRPQNRGNINPWTGRAVDPMTGR